MNHYKDFLVLLFVTAGLKLAYSSPLPQSSDGKETIEIIKEDFKIVSNGSAVSAPNQTIEVEVGLRKIPRQNTNTGGGGDAIGSFVSGVAEALVGVGSSVFTDDFQLGTLIAESSQIIPGDTGDTVGDVLGQVSEPLNSVFKNPLQSLQQYFEDRRTTRAPVRRRTTTVKPTEMPSAEVSYIYLVGNGNGGAAVAGGGNAQENAILQSVLSSQGIISTGPGGAANSLNSQTFAIQQTGPNTGQLINLQQQQEGSNTPGFINRPSFSNQQLGSNRPAFSNQQQGSNRPAFSNQQQGSNNPALSNQQTGSNTPEFGSNQGSSNLPPFSNQQGNFNGQRFPNNQINSNGQRFPNNQGNSNGQLSTNNQQITNGQLFSNNQQGNINGQRFPNNPENSNGPRFPYNPGNSNVQRFPNSPGISNGQQFTNNQGNSIGQRFPNNPGNSNGQRFPNNQGSGNRPVVPNPQGSPNNINNGGQNGETLKNQPGFSNNPDNPTDVKDVEDSHSFTNEQGGPRPVFPGRPVSNNQIDQIFTNGQPNRPLRQPFEDDEAEAANNKPKPVSHTKFKYKVSNNPAPPFVSNTPFDPSSQSGENFNAPEDPNAIAENVQQTNGLGNNGQDLSNSQPLEHGHLEPPLAQATQSKPINSGNSQPSSNPIFPNVPTFVKQPDPANISVQIVQQQATDTPTEAPAPAATSESEDEDDDDEEETENPIVISKKKRTYNSKEK